MTKQQFNSDTTSSIPPNITPSISDVMSGEVDFFKLPPEQREEIKSTYYNEYASEVEKKAWDNGGWCPRPMFKGFDREGQPIEWVDSNVFLERGKKRSFTPSKESVVPTELTRTLEEINKKIEQINEYNRKKEEQEYAQLNNSLDYQIKNAKDELDMERLETLYKQKYKSTSVEPSKAVQQTNPPLDPIIEEWTKQSEWFDKDKPLTEWAIDYFRNNLAGNGKNIFQNLRELDEKAYEQINNDKPPVSMVEKTTNYGFGNTNIAPSIKGSVKRYEDLPGSARQWYDHAINNKKMTTEQAVKNYNQELIYQEQLRKNKEKKGW